MAARTTKATASEIRKGFAETVNRVAYTEESVVIERWGRPLAAIVPYSLYERLQAYLESIEDEMDAEGIVATAGEDLVDFDVAVKGIGHGRTSNSDPAER